MDVSSVQRKLAFNAVLWGFLFALPVIARAQPAKGPANAVEAAAIEYALTEEELQGLVGKQANLLFLNGKTVEGATLEPFAVGRDRDRPKFVVVKHANETKDRRYPVTQLYWIEVEGKKYRVNQLPSLKAAGLQDLDARSEAVKAQLQSAGRELWEDFTDDQRTEFVTEEKAYLQKVGAYFSNLPMQLHETQYFLFFTDMPAGQVGGYIAKLDKMNETLGQAFGFPPGHNVWRGKAVVICFVDKVAYLAFESQFMNYNEADRAQGLCHAFSDGRVVIACFRGDNPDFFAAMLVHETSHGYVHRYLSTVDLPSWVNEGMAEWVATAAVPQSKETTRRRQEGADAVRAGRTLGGILTENLQADRRRYGVAHSLIDMLIKENPDQFRLFLNGMKEGLTFEESLKRAYGVTPEGLADIYGRSLGVAGVTP